MLCFFVVLPSRCKVLVVPVYLDTASIAMRAIYRKLEGARNASRLPKSPVSPVATSYRNVAYSSTTF